MFCVKQMLRHASPIKLMYTISIESSAEQPENDITSSVSLD